MAVLHVAVSVHFRKRVYKTKKILQVSSRFYMKKVFVFSKTDWFLNNIPAPTNTFGYMINVHISNFGGSSWK